MKLRCFLCILWIGSLSVHLHAQPVLVRSTDASGFPKIKVQFYDRNPTEKKSADYGLVENGKQIKFSLKRLSDSASSGKDVLLLFENSYWPEFASQREYFKKALKKVLPSEIKKGDRFFLATFDWTKKDGSVLEMLESAGTDDPDGLLEMIGNIKSPASDNRQHHSTEIFQALSESIEFLKSKRGKNAPAIFILSGEFSNIFNDKFDDEEIISGARKSDIPVYAVRYQRMAGKYSLQRIANETYGMHADADPQNASGSEKILRDFLGSVQKRNNGILYEMEFETRAKADASVHEMELVISGAETTKFSFQSPGFMQWFKKYPWLWGVLAVVLGAIIFFVLNAVKKSKKQRELEKAETEQKMASIQKETADAMAKQQQDFARQAQLKEEEEKKKNKLAAEKADFENRLSRLKIFSRPPSLTDANGGRYFIEVPDLTIGRDGGNCVLTLSDNTVSRTHATIAFEKGPGLAPGQMDGRFFIWDNGSSNGTFLNGKKLPPQNENGFAAAELRNGDVIKLGNVQLVFNF